MTANSNRASLIFDHWACQSLRHQAILARNAQAELATATAAQTAASAVSASLRAATEEAQRALLIKRCVQCLSPWRFCPVCRMMLVLAPHMRPSVSRCHTCARHPRLVPSEIVIAPRLLVFLPRSAHFASASRAVPVLCLLSLFSIFSCMTFLLLLYAYYINTSPLPLPSTLWAAAV